MKITSWDQIRHVRGARLLDPRTLVAVVEFVLDTLRDVVAFVQEKKAEAEAVLEGELLDQPAPDAPVVDAE